MEKLTQNPEAIRLLKEKLTESELKELIEFLSGKTDREIYELYDNVPSDINTLWALLFPKYISNETYELFSYEEKETKLFI